jgi:hypothetical protein
MGPGPNVIKLFLSVIFEFLYQAEVLVPARIFQPSMMFVSKAGAYPSGTSFEVLSSWP